MITLELTEEQRRQLAASAGTPVQVLNPENNRSYMLVPSKPLTVSDFTPEQLRRIKDSGFTPEEILQTIAHSTETSYEVHPMMVQSQKAFWRDLPELLKQRKLRKRWVCYHGDERIGISRDDAELVQACLKRGLDRGQFYLGRIVEHPLPPWEREEMEQSLFEFED